jgi:hypothetical protein
MPARIIGGLLSARAVGFGSKSLSSPQSRTCFSSISHLPSITSARCSIVLFWCHPGDSPLWVGRRFRIPCSTLSLRPAVLSCGKQSRAHRGSSARDCFVAQNAPRNDSVNLIGICPNPKKTVMMQTDTQRTRTASFGNVRPPTALRIFQLAAVRRARRAP